MTHLPVRQGVLGTACFWSTCCQLGLWTGSPRMVPSHGWHVGTGRSARAEAWEHQSLSTWAPSPHRRLWLLAAWAGFQEQASQETGSGSCQRLKAGTQILAQHLVYSVHLSDSHKARFKGGGDIPLVKGKLDQKIWRPCFETTTGAQTRSFLGKGGGSFRPSCFQHHGTHAGWMG